MIYALRFHLEAEKEWHKLDNSIRLQFLNVLEKRLQNPRVPSAKLHDAPDCYKIKLKSIGYRLVYQVIDDQVVVLVLAIGKRERSAVYRKMNQRF